MLLARSSIASVCTKRCITRGSSASRLRIAPIPVSTHHTSVDIRNSSIICRYTSVPERMGEEEGNPSAAVPEGADTPDELYRRDEARRLREQAEQTKAMGVLHDLETAAMQANPEAGHPEHRRALDTIDYPPPAPRPTQPAGTGNWIEPQLAQGLPWLGVTNTEDQHQQQQQQQGAGSETVRDDSSNRTGRPQKAGDSIYDDNSQFEAWFNKP